MVEILSCCPEKERYKVKIKENPFYVDGKGGQIGDRGFIGESEVLFVDENYLYLSKEIELGKHEYIIDMKRREAISKQHTAQHLFSAIVYNDFNIDTIAWRMSENYCTVDFDIDVSFFTPEVVVDIESRVNKSIDLGSVVKEYIVSNEEAMKIVNLRRKIKDKLKGDIRLVEIEGYDLIACTGFHVKNIININIFKITNFEKVLGDKTRFYFLAGDKAFQDYSFKHSLIKDFTQRFSCTDIEILAMLEKNLKEKEEISNRLNNIIYKYSEILAKDIGEITEKINGIEVIIYLEDKMVGDYLRKFINLDEKLLILADGNNFSLLSNKINCKELIKNIVNKFPEIKGGGGANKGNIKGNLDREKLVKVLEDTLNVEE